MQSMTHTQAPEDPFLVKDVYYEGHRYSFVGNIKRNFYDNRVATAVAAADSSARLANGRDGDARASGTRRT